MDTGEPASFAAGTGAACVDVETMFSRRACPCPDPFREGQPEIGPYPYEDVVAPSPAAWGAARCEGRARRQVGTGTGPGHGRPPQALHDRRHRGI